MRYECPCCGEKTLEDDEVLCLYCGWQSDPVCDKMPDFVGGPNKISLRAAKLLVEQGKDVHEEPLDKKNIDL